MKKATGNSFLKLFTAFLVLVSLVLPNGVTILAESYEPESQTTLIERIYAESGSSIEDGFYAMTTEDLCNYFGISPDELPETGRGRAGLTGILVTNKTYTSTNKLSHSDHLTSAAKGQTVTLGYNYSYTVTASVSGSFYDKLTLGLNGEIKVTYSRTDTFTGPPEGSPYNSRSFGVKYYINTGAYMSFVYLNGGILSANLHTFSEPAYHDSYSTDKIVN